MGSEMCIRDSVLPASAKWNFEVLSGQEEASLEWISVKHAMAIEFSEEPPIAALAGGKGSVQTSMDGAGGHGAHHLSARVALKEGIALVETDEIEGWRTACTASITQPFGPLREQLQKHSRADSPIRICLLYTSPSPRDLSTSRMPSSA